MAFRFYFIYRLFLIVGILSSFQHCTAWPGLTALLTLAGGEGGSGILLIPPSAPSDATVNPEGGTSPITNQPVGDTPVPNPPNHLTSNTTGDSIFFEGVAISPIIISGVGLQSCSISPALPLNLTLDSTTCTISGTPSVGSAVPLTTFTITGNFPNSQTSTITTSFAIQGGITGLTVNNPGPHIYFVDIPIVPVVFTSSGGPIALTGCTLQSPPSLPAGLTLARTSDTTCTISGTPLSPAPNQIYTIRVGNPAGFREDTVAFSVNILPPQNFNYPGFPSIFTVGVPILPAIFPTVNGILTSCRMDPLTPLPAGILLDLVNCSISGTPTLTTSASTYNIIPSNSSGDGTQANISFSVQPFPAVISVTSPVTNGAYRDGAIIPIHVIFNNNVNVSSGIPQLALNTGSPATTVVNLFSGSGTNTLVFNYIVMTGNNSADLTYINASSLFLNGAFVRDSQSNNADLTLPIPYQPNSLSSNKNIVIDTTVPIISAVSPTTSANVNNTSVSYTLSETCASGFTRWTRVGGNPDPGSPHTANWVGSELNSGTRTNVVLTNNPNLVDGAIYDLSFSCTDLAGNVALDVISTSVTYTAGALVIVSAETLDSDNNGKIDSYRIAFNRPVNDSTFPGYVSNSQGSAISQWLVAGYSNIRMIHGTAVTFAVDTINDAILYIRFNENPLDCTSVSTIGCDTNSKPDLTTTASPGLRDLATNLVDPLNTLSVVEADGARPILVGARSLGATLVDAIFSEPVNQADSELISNYSITPGITVLTANRNAISQNIVRLTTTNQIGGSTLTMDISTSVRDLANLNLNTLIHPINLLPSNRAIFTGLVRPVVESIVTISATTLRISFNEPIVATSAECSTQTSCAMIYQNLSLPVLNSISTAGQGNNSATFFLTVNPMIEGQPYTLLVLANTVQSVSSSERIGNTDNSATFNGDGKPNANISTDTVTACPIYNTLDGVARRVVVQYDQTVMDNAGANAANNPINYSINGCITGNCTSGNPQTQASVVTNLGANKFAVDFLQPFNTADQIYQMRIANVQDTNGNSIPLPGTLSFQCGNDNTPPSLLSVTVVSAINSATVLILNFSESVDSVSTNVSGNYRFNTNAFGFGVNSAAREATNNQVRLTFTPGLPNGGHQLRVQLVRDLAGNVILDNGVNNVQPFILNAATGFSGGNVFQDPFGDGTPAANIVIYDDKLYVGADQSGSKLFETNFSLTMAQTISIDADGVFGMPISPFNGFPSRWSGCASILYPSSPCAANNTIAGVDTIYASCVGGSSNPDMTGSQCSSSGGTEFIFIGALNTMGNYRSFWQSTTKSANSTVFQFNEQHSGDTGGAAAYRSMNLRLFKDQLFVNFGAELGGGGRGGRVCMNPTGCLDGTTFLQRTGFPNMSRARRIGASGTNSLRNGSFNGVAGYGSGDANTQVLNAINVMFEHDNDGAGANPSQLYIANGGFFVNPLPTSSPWIRTGSSDGGILRTVLSRSTRTSLPDDCPNNPTGCSDFWEDVTPDTREKWSRYLSIPLPQNSAATGAGNCSTSLIEIDCTEPYNLFIPALKAIPYMRTAPNGDLYMVRNACSTKDLCRNGMSCTNGVTTWSQGFRQTKQVCPPGLEIPQLWRMVQNCGTATNCTNNGWELVAERGSSGRTDMGNANNSHISLLEIVGSYLYIGFDNPVNGANVWRVDMNSVPSSSILTQSNFNQVNINGLGADSSGSNQKLFSHVTLNNDGRNWLILTTRDGVGAVRIYRTGNHEN